MVPRRRRVEVDGACAGRKGGLDRVEEDGVGEACVLRPVRRRRDALLEVGPAQAVFLKN